MELGLETEGVFIFIMTMILERNEEEDDLLFLWGTEMKNKDVFKRLGIG